MSNAMKINTIIVRSSVDNINVSVAQQLNLLENTYFIEKIGNCDTIVCDININYADNIILTSNNAINSVEILPKNKKFFVIGVGLALELKQYGYNNIKSFNNVSEMLDSINKDDKYIYLRGEKISFDLSSELLNISEYIVYKINYNDKLSDNTIKLIQNGEINKVCILSHFTTIKFIELLLKNCSFDDMKNIQFFVKSIKSLEYLINLNLQCKVIT